MFYGLKIASAYGRHEGRARVQTATRMLHFHRMQFINVLEMNTQIESRIWGIIALQAKLLQYIVREREKMCVCVLSVILFTLS